MPKVRTSDGLELTYTTRGDADGAPILFLHGLHLTGAMWDEAASRLPRGWRGIMPDLRGHGATPPAPPGVDATADPSPSVARLARDAIDLLDVVAPMQPAVIAGLSMGGYVAFEIFRLASARVRALVLVDTRAGADNEEAARAREIKAHTALRGGGGEIADEMVQRIFGSSASPSLREQYRGIIAASNPAGMAWTLRALARRPDSVPTLPTIRIPTLIVVGSEDQVTPPAEARAMQAAIRGARLAEIPGAGHMTPVEQPHEFSRVLSEFLESLP